MAETIILYELDPNEVMEIVRDLRSRGLTQGTNFDFAYQQAKFDNFSYEAVERKQTKFTFYDGSEKWATWLLLKHSESQSR